MNVELSQTLKILEGLATKARIINDGQHNSDLQKAIVGIIRGSEFAFEELTGVKYHTYSNDDISDPEITTPN